MNLGLSNLLKKEFPNINCLNRPNYLTNNDRLDPDWVSGIIEGDGSFNIYISEVILIMLMLFLSIFLNIREKPLLIKIKDFFDGKGNIYSYNLEMLLNGKLLNYLISFPFHLILILIL
jgi:hypothetical protein